MDALCSTFTRKGVFLKVLLKVIAQTPVWLRGVLERQLRTEWSQVEPTGNK